MSSRVNRLLRHYGVEMVRVRNTYIPAAQTVADAARAGKTVREHLDPDGQVNKIIDRIEAATGPLAGLHAVEIGAGSGRYLDEVLARGATSEVYETAGDWADWLHRTYPATVHDADGRTLAHTRDASADLVHAHGVFTYLPPLAVLDYLAEAARVLKPVGVVAFDLFRAESFDPDPWFAAVDRYPTLMPSQLLDRHLDRLGLVIEDEFRMPYGRSESDHLTVRRPGR